MAFVTILCSRTGKHVATGMETDRRGFAEIMPSQQFTMRCLLCGEEHVWSKRWAALEDKDPALSRLEGNEPQKR